MKGSRTVLRLENFAKHSSFKATNCNNVLHKSFCDFCDEERDVTFLRLNARATYNKLSYLEEEFVKNKLDDSVHSTDLACPLLYLRAMGKGFYLYFVLFTNYVGSKIAQDVLILACALYPVYNHVYFRVPLELR